MMTEDNHLTLTEELLQEKETMAKATMGLVAAEDQTMDLELLSRGKMIEDHPLMGADLP